MPLWPTNHYQVVRKEDRPWYDPPGRIGAVSFLHVPFDFHEQWAGIAAAIFPTELSHERSVRALSR